MLSQALSSPVITNSAMEERFQEAAPVVGTRRKSWFLHSRFQGRTNILRIVFML